jgi:hypothetical protein
MNTILREFYTGAAGGISEDAAFEDTLADHLWIYPGYR